MASRSPQKRRSATPPARQTVKASICVDVELHARWSAAASLRGMDRSAFAVDVLREALRGIVIIDRRKKSADDADPSSDVDRIEAA